MPGITIFKPEWIARLVMIRRRFGRLALLLLVLFAGACRPDAAGDNAAVFAPDNNSGVDDTAGGETDDSAGAYPSKVSVLPGESLDFHISNGYGGKYSLSIYREGATRVLMGTIPDVETGN
ncbi:MAG TPA: hypothetical protein PLR07_09075, partial [Promineifilum sp.]|nr:hypothetical protein [Promineifilum sp.]